MKFLDYFYFRYLMTATALGGWLISALLEYPPGVMFAWMLFAVSSALWTIKGFIDDKY